MAKSTQSTEREWCVSEYIGWSRAGAPLPRRQERHALARRRGRGPKLLKRAATTSDFSAIIEGALPSSIRRRYEDEPESHRGWVRVVPFVPGRPSALSSAPGLDKLGEGSEYRHGFQGCGFRPT